MDALTDHRSQPQEHVNAHFDAKASYWNDLYTADGVQTAGVMAEVIQARQAQVLEWIDELALGPGTRALEVGPGAGFLTVELVRRGFQVEAVDASEAMVELTRQRAEDSGILDLVSPRLGDVCSLECANDSFDVVVAVGVISWLERPEVAVREMARVTRPGGHVILTTPNRAQLCAFLDPWRNPVLRPLKRRAIAAFERAGLRRHRRPRPTPTHFNRSFLDRSLANAGLVNAADVTLGFGPFTLRGRSILPPAVGVALHRRLQRLADRGAPWFRSLGMFHMVLARKPALRPLAD